MAAAPPTSSPDAPEPPPFGGTHWRLARLHGKPVGRREGPREAHLVFDESSHRVSGCGGCNRLMGPYERSGVHLSFGILATTMMYCEDTMELESEFLGALGAVKGWRRVDRGLELSDGEGEVLARFEPEDTADPPDPATPPSSGGA